MFGITVLLWPDERQQRVELIVLLSPSQSNKHPSTGPASTGLPDSSASNIRTQR